MPSFLIWSKNAWISCLSASGIGLSKVYMFFRSTRFSYDTISLHSEYKKSRWSVIIRSSHWFRNFERELHRHKLRNNWWFGKPFKRLKHRSMLKWFDLFRSTLFHSRFVVQNYNFIKLNILPDVQELLRTFILVFKFLDDFLHVLADWTSL